MPRPPPGRSASEPTHPPAMRISVPEDVGSNVEAIVARDGAHWWKLVRTFDDPATWTQPGIRHLAASGPDGDRFRTVPLADEWELYDLTVDPIEVTNLWETATPELRNRLVERLEDTRRDCVPARNASWRYATRRAGSAGTTSPRLDSSRVRSARERSTDPRCIRRWHDCTNGRLEGGRRPARLAG